MLSNSYSVISPSEGGIYIHIPFCTHKCIYCDFYSIVTLQDKNEFIQALIKEIELKSVSESLPEDIRFSTIFFGGGTPSLLSTTDISTILTALRKHLKIIEHPEITVEANPGTLDEEKINAYKETGITRLSIGVQSFHNDDLKFLTRIHDRDSAIHTIETAARAGLDNINIDLIFNLPGHTLEKWMDNLRQAVSLPVKHISTYSLIVEDGTVLHKMERDGIVSMNPDDDDADFYYETIDFLSGAGFQQYEVSNFAQEEYKCRHNLLYWRYNNYLGFGPSAHSFIGTQRSWNIRQLRRYLDRLSENQLPIDDFEQLTTGQKLEEFVFLHLRSEGIDTDVFSEKFGEIKEKLLLWEFNGYEKEGYIRRTGNVYSYTKEGYMLADELSEKIIRAVE